MDVYSFRLLGVWRRLGDVDEVTCPRFYYCVCFNHCFINFSKLIIYEKIQDLEHDDARSGDDGVCDSM